MPFLPLFIGPFTGGVTSELFTSDILDKDRFWTNELMKVNQSFLFGLAQMDGFQEEKKGIHRGHAYSIMEAKELDNFRLLKISARNYNLAHAKGELRESGLEREERLRKQRRERRKVQAREAFEQHRLFMKREKLKKMRIEAKAKPGKVDEIKDIQNKDDLAIQINISGHARKVDAASGKIDKTLSASGR